MPYSYSQLATWYAAASIDFKSMLGHFVSPLKASAAELVSSFEFPKVLSNSWLPNFPATNKQPKIYIHTHHMEWEEGLDI